MDRRLLVLVSAAAAIGGLCAFKATRSYPPPSSVAARGSSQPAPAFELYDQQKPSRIVRLASYLGRKRVIVVFFDGQAGAHASAVLQRFREEAGRLRKADVQVIAISTALPQQNRKEIADDGAFPFPLLSDPDLHVHRAWGRFDDATRQPRTGVFLIDRKGWVTWSRVTNAPQPLDDWRSAVDGILSGDSNSKRDT